MIGRLTKAEPGVPASDRYEGAAVDFGLGVGVISASLLVHFVPSLWAGLPVAGVLTLLRAAFVLRREGRGLRTEQ